MADSTKEPELPKETVAEHSAIDPELIKLPRPKTRVRPVTALAIVGICLTLTVRLFSDLQFSRNDADAVSVANLADLGEEFENSFVEIEARPDRPQALRVIPSRRETGQVLVPVLGTAGKLWLLLEASPWNEEARTDERYRGRLTRLSSVDFSEALQTRLKSSKQIPRPIALSEIRNALQNKTKQVHDGAGDRFELHADTVVSLKETATNRTRIVAVTTDSYKDEDGWRLALQNANLLQIGSQAISSTPSSWTFDVEGQVQEVSDKLVVAKLFAAKAMLIETTRVGRWSELALDGDDILLGQARVGFHTSGLALGLAPQLHGQSYVLNTTETPDTYWYVPLLFSVLALFGLLFAFAFYRRVR